MLKTDNINIILEEVDDIKKIMDNHKKFNIINAGLLKAGKSELFNAISGQDVFETGVVRTTIENKELDLEQYVLIDTPGLDANFEDSKVAFEGYKNADIMVFVHNAVDGELNKVEVESIEKIIGLYDNKKTFFDSSILVISHVDQLSDEKEEEKLLNIINNQIKKVFNEEFGYIIGVNSTGYIKGLKEDKKLLMESSNILNLKNILSSMIKDGISCFNSSINKLKSECEEKINKEIELLKQKEKDIKIEDNSKKILEAKRKIETIKNKCNSYSKNMEKIKVDSISRGMFSGTKCYSKYKSSSSARSAAERACKNIISEAASRARGVGSSIVATYESEYLNCKSLNLKLMEDYNEIKKVYYDVCKNNNIPNLSFKQAQVDRNKLDILNITKECVTKYIASETFNSADGYFNAYSGNLYIEEDYDEEYVDGLFGGKWKKVRYYTYDMDGAVDDVCSDYKEILEYRLDDVYKGYNEIYQKSAEQMLSQYKTQVDKLISSLDAESSKGSSEYNNKRKEKDAILKNIETLKEAKKYLR